MERVLVCGTLAHRLAPESVFEVGDPSLRLSVNDLSVHRGKVALVFGFDAFELLLLFLELLSLSGFLFAPLSGQQVLLFLGLSLESLRVVDAEVLRKVALLVAARKLAAVLVQLWLESLFFSKQLLFFLS